MKARSLGRFVAEFLEGFLETESATAQQPMVIPVEAITQTVKAAVHEMLDPLLAAEDQAQQLDLGFPEVEQAPLDPVTAMAMQRMAEAQARAAAREEAMGREPDRPTQYDPNSPTGGAPWMSAI